MRKPRKAVTPRSTGGPGIRDIPLRLVIPNMITVLAICAGLSGVRLAFEGRYELGVAMLLIAAFLDFIDGRTARLLKASSKFGAQMDSLADIVNFGVVPALVLYAFLLHFANSIGWIAALLFAIACALRLARFNVMADDPDRPAWQSDYFVGVPAPVAAVLALLPIYIGFIGVPLTPPFAFAASAYTIFIALLMISRIRVYSGKGPRKRISRDYVLPLIFLVVLYVLLLFTYTWYTLTASCAIYLLLLPLSMRAYARRERREAEGGSPSQAASASSTRS